MRGLNTLMGSRRLRIWIGLGMYTSGRIRGMCEDKGVLVMGCVSMVELLVLVSSHCCLKSNGDVWLRLHLYASPPPKGERKKGNREGKTEKRRKREKEDRMKETSPKTSYLSLIHI